MAEAVQCKPVPELRDALSFDLPWRIHFAFSCSCGAACVADPALSKELADLTDPKLVFESFSADDQKSLAEFWTEHEKQGHTVRPTLLQLAPLPKA